MLNTSPDNYVQVAADWKLGDTRNIVFHCQVVGLDASKDLQFALESEFVSEYVFYSYDNENWIRTEAAVDEIHQIPLDGNAVYVSSFAPYLVSRNQSFLDSLANLNLEYVFIDELASTEEGLSLEFVKFTDTCVDDAPKKVIWILCRQHAGEVPASYVMEGMLQAFVSETWQMQRLRREAIIYVVPLVDIDMISVGGTGKDQEPVDFNRDWITPSHDSNWSAVETIKQMMAEDTNELSLFLDLHTFAPGEPANVHIVVDDPDQLRFTKNFDERTIENGGLSYGSQVWPASQFNTATSQDYVYEYHYSPNLLSLTPETAYDLAPDGELWTEQKLINQGIAFGKACSDYINGLDKPMEQVVEEDDPVNTQTGTWTSSVNFAGYSGDGYLYADPNTDASFTFNLTANSTGLFGVSTHYSSNENRANNVPYELSYQGTTRQYLINQEILGSRWLYLDTISLTEGAQVSLSVKAFNANEFVIADAFRIYPIEICEPEMETGITPQFQTGPQITCYPNPSSAAFTIELKKAAEGMSYTAEVYDVMGALIKEKMPLIIDGRINVSIQEKGLYFVHVLDNRGQLMTVSKVTIQ